MTPGFRPGREDVKEPSRSAYRGPETQTEALREAAMDRGLLPPARPHLLSTQALQSKQSTVRTKHVKYEPIIIIYILNCIL